MFSCGMYAHIQKIYFVQKILSLYFYFSCCLFLECDDDDDDEYNDDDNDDDDDVYDYVNPW